MRERLVTPGQGGVKSECVSSMTFAGKKHLTDEGQSEESLLGGRGEKRFVNLQRGTCFV